MVSKGCFCAFSGSHGKILGQEPTKKSALLSDADSRLPLSVLFVEVDPLRSARVVPLDALVSGVCNLVCRPEIADPVVVSDSIDVVDLLWRGAVVHNPDHTSNGKVLSIEDKFEVSMSTHVSHRPSRFPVSSRLFRNKLARLLVITEGAAEVFLTRVFGHMSATDKGLYYAFK